MVVGSQSSMVLVNTEDQVGKGGLMREVDDTCPNILE